MPMPLQEWDKKVAPLLRKMASDARWAAYYAKSITGSANHIPIRPEWLTESEDAILKAAEEIQETVQCLNSVVESMKEAVETFRKKKVDL